MHNFNRKRVRDDDNDGDESNPYEDESTNSVNTIVDSQNDHSHYNDKEDEKEDEEKSPSWSSSENATNNGMEIEYSENNYSAEHEPEQDESVAPSQYVRNVQPDNFNFYNNDNTDNNNNNSQVIEESQNDIVSSNPQKATTSTLEEQQKQQQQEEEEEKEELSLPMTTTTVVNTDVNADHDPLEQTTLSLDILTHADQISEHVNSVTKELAKVNGNVINTLLCEWHNARMPLRQVYNVQEELTKHLLRAQRQNVKSISNWKCTEQLSKMQQSVISVLQEYFSRSSHDFNANINSDNEHEHESKHDEGDNNARNNIGGNLGNSSSSNSNNNNNIKNSIATILTTEHNDKNNLLSMLWNRLLVFIHGPLQYMQEQLTAERQHNNYLAINVQEFFMSVMEQVNEHASRALRSALECIAKDVQLARLQAAYSFEQARSNRRAMEIKMMQQTLSNVLSEHKNIVEKEATLQRHKRHLLQLEKQMSLNAVVASCIDHDDALHQLAHCKENTTAPLPKKSMLLHHTHKAHKTESVTSAASASEIAASVSPAITMSDAALKAKFDVNRWNTVKSAAPSFFALRMLAHSDITLSELIDDWVNQEKRIMHAETDLAAMQSASARVRHDAMTIHELYQSERQRRIRVEERLNYALREHVEIGACVNRHNTKAKMTYVSLPNNKSSNTDNIIDINNNNYYKNKNKNENFNNDNKHNYSVVDSQKRNALSESYTPYEQIPLVVNELYSLQTECNKAKDDVAHLSVSLQLAREEVLKLQDENKSLHNKMGLLEQKLDESTVARQFDELRKEYENRWRSLENEYIDVQSQLRLMTALAEERGKANEELQLEIERCREENKRLREYVANKTTMTLQGNKRKGENKEITHEVRDNNWITLENATQEIINVTTALDKRVASSHHKMKNVEAQKESIIATFNDQLTKLMESCHNSLEEFSQVIKHACVTDEGMLHEHHTWKKVDNNITSKNVTDTNTNVDHVREQQQEEEEEEEEQEEESNLQHNVVHTYTCALEQVQLLESTFKRAIEFLILFMTNSLNERSLSTQVSLVDGQEINTLRRELAISHFNETTLQKQLKSALELVERHHLNVVQDALMHEITISSVKTTETSTTQESKEIAEQVATLTAELETTRATNFNSLTALQKLATMKEEMENKFVDEQTRRILSSEYIMKLNALLSESYARERVLSAENERLHKEKEELVGQIVAHASNTATQLQITNDNIEELSSEEKSEKRQLDDDNEEATNTQMPTLQSMLKMYEEKLELIYSLLHSNSKKEESTDITSSASDAVVHHEMANTAEIGSTAEVSIPTNAELALQLANGGMSTIVQLLQRALIKTQLVQDAVETSALQTTVALATSTTELYQEVEERNKNDTDMRDENENEMEMEMITTTTTTRSVPSKETTVMQSDASVEEQNKLAGKDVVDRHGENKEEIEHALKLARLAKRVEFLENEIKTTFAEKESINARLHNAELHSAKAEENNRRMLDITKTLLEKQQRLIAENKSLKSQLSCANSSENVHTEAEISASTNSTLQHDDNNAVNSSNTINNIANVNDNSTHDNDTNATTSINEAKSGESETDNLTEVNQADINKSMEPSCDAKERKK